MKRVACLAAGAALLGCAAAHAYPKRPDGPVLDLADIFPSAEEAALSQRLTTYWSKSGNALVVVSVSSLDGQSLEDYARGLFHEWGIGDAKANRGLLVLVAPTEHKVRIEVGCGLIGTVTDDQAAEIIQDDMIPKFKADDLDGGTLAGVDALIEIMRTFKPVNDNNPHAAACRAITKNAA